MGKQYIDSQEHWEDSVNASYEHQKEIEREHQRQIEKQISKQSYMVTRIAKLKGFPDILAGRDLAKIFEEGHLYSVNKVMDMIMVKDLGEYAVGEYHDSFPSIMQDGTYLLTKEENKKQRK